MRIEGALLLFWGLGTKIFCNLEPFQGTGGSDEDELDEEHGLHWALESPSLAVYCLAGRAQALESQGKCRHTTSGMLT